MITTPIKLRYRLKITVANASGSLGFVLKLFPNALTFVGYPTNEQLSILSNPLLIGLLASFGVGLEVGVS